MQLSIHRLLFVTILLFAVMIAQAARYDHYRQLSRLTGHPAFYRRERVIALATIMILCVVVIALMARG